MKVAAVTPDVRVADPDWNAARICESLDACFAKKVKIIVLPELCLTGYTCADLFFQERLLDSAKKALCTVAAHTGGHDSLVFAGLPLEKDGKLYNVAAAVQDGKILAFIPKRNIPNYGEFYEARYFAAGMGEVDSVDFDGEKIPFGGNILLACLGMPGLVIGCEICEDLWVADPPSVAHQKAGATVIVNLSASNETVGKEQYRKILLQAASGRLVAGYVYSSAGQGESTQDLVFSGHNMILENGVVLAQAQRFCNGITVSELDIDRLCHERRRMRVWGGQEPADYVRVAFFLEKEETPLTRTFAPLPFVPSDQETKRERCEEILTMQACGLQKRLAHTGCKSAVVGVSGGLDSTLALLVAARAFDSLGLDRRGILSVTMPCFGTTDRTYDNACRLAKALKTTLRKVHIREAVQVHFRDIGQAPDCHDVTYENGQARERTQVLMDLANQTGGMVIGTGDLSELALGWATYNGDHMSMYGVNAGVPKTLVRHLVQYAADTCREEGLRTVLSDVLDTPVSPELLPPVDGCISQKTEELVGPYELHDFFLYYMLRCGFSPAKIYRLAGEAFAGVYGEGEILKWLRIFYKRFFTQQFKRSCLPDGPKVGSVALSPRGDWRMPSDASMAAWQAELEKIRA